MNTLFHEYNMVAIQYKHAEMMRQAEHERLVRAVRQHNKVQRNQFARIMRSMAAGFASIAQRMQQNTRQASGHAR